MEDDKNKKKREANIPEREANQSLFSAPVMIVVIVACLAGIFGSFHYSNKTTVELKQESRTDLNDEYQSATVEDLQAGSGHNSGYSAITQPSTEPTLSLDMKTIDKFENKKILTSADGKTTERMDDKDQKEREETPGAGSNTLTYQELDKEISDSTERNIYEEYITLGTDKKSDTMTAVKKEEATTEPEINSSPSLEDKAEASTTPGQGITPSMMTAVKKEEATTEPEINSSPSMEDKAEASTTPEQEITPNTMTAVKKEEATTEPKINSSSSMEDKADASTTPEQETTPSTMTAVKKEEATTEPEINSSPSMDDKAESSTTPGQGITTSTMTAVKKEEATTEPEINSSPSMEDKAEASTTPEQGITPSTNDKQVVKDKGEDKFKILPRRDGVKVGHVQNLELEPGKFYDVITRSLNPPIFEIPDFLAEDECQKLIDQATKLGLDRSEYQVPDVGVEETNQETFKGWDYDGDNVITPQEIVYTLQDTAYLFFTTADVEKMFVDLNIDENSNGAMDLDEYLRVTKSRIVRYLKELSETLPRTRHRNSRQTWLHYNDVDGLNERVSALTKLPVEVVERSEKLQVVNYGPEGHYYCHTDSQDIEDGVPCCLFNSRRKCRLCRYITVLYYLNNVEEGGETAFPLADNATFSHEEWVMNIKHHCDLSKHCHQANVYVKPRQGTAIMWYNHLRDEQTGWLGRIDPRSYHGGCDVIKGHKWIANSWINIVGEPGDKLVAYHPTSDPIP